MKKIRVDYGAERAYVTVLDEGGPSEDLIAKTIEGAGFKSFPASKIVR